MESSLYVERAAGLGWRRHPRYRVREGPAQREGDPQDRSCCRRRARLHLRNSRKDGEDQKHELSPATESHLRCEKCHWRPISLRWSPTCDFPSIDRFVSWIPLLALRARRCRVLRCIVVY